jgi:hypothetical protein
MRSPCLRQKSLVPVKALLRERWNKSRETHPERARGDCRIRRGLRSDRETSSRKRKRKRKGQETAAQKGHAWKKTVARVSVLRVLLAHDQLAMWRFAHRAFSFAPQERHSRDCAPTFLLDPIFFTGRKPHALNFIRSHRSTPTSSGSSAGTPVAKPRHSDRAGSSERNEIRRG